MILHTQSYTKTENLILSKELNDKFNLATKVISQIYWVIEVNSKDALILYGNHTYTQAWVIKFLLPFSILQYNESL